MTRYMSNQWGGTRHGAGRKPYNPNSRDIRNMFAAAPMFPNNDNDADNNEGDNIVQPPPDGDAPPTNNNNTADSNDGPRENAQATPTTARDEHSQWSNDTWRDIPLATLEKRKKGRVLSGLLKDQVEKYKKDNKKKKARESVRNGILWSSPKYIRHGDIADLRQSWREFFTMRVFHWIPLEVMPKDWMPKCPNCGSACVKNGTTNPPRLVYGLRENYLLDAPQRLLCTECLGTANRQKEEGVLKDGRVQYSFLCTDPAIMDQIEEMDPILASEFPCILSHVNGIDDELFALIEHLATKGVGPMTIADMVLSFHEATWQKNELRWLAHLDRRLKNPLPFDAGLRLEEVELCPSYFSEEMGGASPSDTFLMYMFCRHIERKKPYYDADVAKRLRTCLSGSIDASYKIGKKMNQKSRDKHYDTMHIIMNEYQETVFHKWSDGDSHDELKRSLEKLRDIGFDPAIMFTDDPDRDRNLLMSIFPGLRKGVDDEAFSIASQDASACGLNALPTRGNYNYIYSGENANFAITNLMDELGEADDEDKIVSIDAGKCMHLSLSQPFWNLVILQA